MIKGENFVVNSTLSNSPSNNRANSNGVENKDVDLALKSVASSASSEVLAKGLSSG